jgi:hypothetical protein
MKRIYTASAAIALMFVLSMSAFAHKGQRNRAVAISRQTHINSNSIARPKGVIGITGDYRWLKRLNRRSIVQNGGQGTRHNIVRQ